MSYGYYPYPHQWAYQQAIAQQRAYQQAIAQQRAQAAAQAAQASRQANAQRRAQAPAAAAQAEQARRQAIYNNPVPVTRNKTRLLQLKRNHYEVYKKKYGNNKNLENKLNVLQTLHNNKNVSADDFSKSAIKFTRYLLTKKMHAYANRIIKETNKLKTALNASKQNMSSSKTTQALENAVRNYRNKIPNLARNV